MELPPPFLKNPTLSTRGRLKFEAHRMDEGTENQRGKATSLRPHSSPPSPSPGQSEDQRPDWASQPQGSPTGPDARFSSLPGKRTQPSHPAAPPAPRPLASEDPSGRGDEPLGRGMPPAGPLAGHRDSTTSTQPGPRAAEPHSRPVTWPRCPRQTRGLTLTIVFPAVLFHVNLQLPFRGLAVGIAVCRGGRAQTKPN